MAGKQKSIATEEKKKKNIKAQSEDHSSSSS